MTGRPQLVEKDCVLVVDDEQDILATLTELIEMAGCSTIVATNGVEALKIMRERLPCLIILDLLMPVMDGNEFLDALKKDPALSKVPVLISTSAPGRAPVGMPVATKPIDIKFVWEWVRRTCSCAPRKDLGIVQ
jgi:CheY-like chemotaxis protein